MLKPAAARIGKGLFCSPTVVLLEIGSAACDSELNQCERSVKVLALPTHKTGFPRAKSGSLAGDPRRAQRMTPC